MRGYTLWLVPALSAVLLGGCATDTAELPPDTSQSSGLEAELSPTPSGPQPCDVTTERDISRTIGTQIEALKVGDFAAAYAMASPSFQSQVSEAGFEAVIKGSFGVLLETSSFTLSNCQVLPEESRALTVVTIRTTSNEVSTLTYQVRETTTGWRIEGAAFSDPVTLGV